MASLRNEQSGRLRGVAAGECGLTWGSGVSIYRYKILGDQKCVLVETYLHEHLGVLLDIRDEKIVCCTPGSRRVFLLYGISCAGLGHLKGIKNRGI